MFDFENLTEKLVHSNAPTQEIPDHRLGAVLIPIFPKSNKILFIKRSAHLKNHPGQIAFPGGAYEDTDRNLLDACLRETLEEVGIPAKKIRILGRLEPLKTTSKFYVYPFVGLVESDVKITIDPNEVEKVFFVPLPDLLNISNQEEVEYRDYIFTHYNVQGITVWGVTSQILTDFLSKIEEI